MIKKDVEFEGMPTDFIMEFGHGDISVTGFKKVDNKLVGIAFKNQEPHQIGVRDASTCGAELKNSDSSILMTFTKVESIEVLERALREAKIRLKSYL